MPIPGHGVETSTAGTDGLAIAVLTESDRVSPERTHRIARNRVRQWLS